MASDTADEPTYSNLAELRGELTVDDAERRSAAYSAVFEADVEPSQVVQTEVPDEVVTALADGGVIPADASQDAMETQEYRRQVLGLLEDIAANTGGGS